MSRELPAALAGAMPIREARRTAVPGTAAIAARKVRRRMQRLYRSGYVPVVSNSSQCRLTPREGTLPSPTAEPVCADARRVILGPFSLP
jgi:hypothetical protein